MEVLGAVSEQVDAKSHRINRVNTLHSNLDGFLAGFKWCRAFMTAESGTAERAVARQLANGVCRSRIRDMFNVYPPYMDYWIASTA